MAEGAEVEIRYGLRPPDGLRAECIHRGHYYPVCAPGYRATLETLAEHPLFHCTNLLGNWSQWAEEQALDWTDPPVTYATTFSVTMAIAASGGGLALAHDLIAKHLIEEGRLTAPFEYRAQMPEAYYLILSPEGEQSEPARRFVSWLKDEMAVDDQRAG